MPTTNAAVDNSAAQAQSANRIVVPLNKEVQGKTYGQWVVSFWQWALALPTGPFLPHPFNLCSRPFSAGQSGNVWYWSAPNSPFPQTCNQSASVIPAGTSIFLSTLDVEASSLDATPYFATTAAGQLAIANRFTDRIEDLFVTIDNVPVANVTAYRVTTGQFTFFAPTPWVYGPRGGTGTAVADGYYLILKPLPTGSHTIHYGGRRHFLPGDFGPGVPVPPDVVEDITLLITVGPS